MIFGKQQQREKHETSENGKNMKILNDIPNLAWCFKCERDGNCVCAVDCCNCGFVYRHWVCVCFEPCMSLGVSERRRNDTIYLNRGNATADRPIVLLTIGFPCRVRAFPLKRKIVPTNQKLKHGKKHSTINSTFLLCTQPKHICKLTESNSILQRHTFCIGTELTAFKKSTPTDRSLSTHRSICVWHSLFTRRFSHFHSYYFRRTLTNSICSDFSFFLVVVLYEFQKEWKAKKI